MAKRATSKGFETVVDDVASDDGMPVAEKKQTDTKNYEVLLDGTIIDDKHYKAGDVLAIEATYARQLTDAGICLSETDKEVTDGNS